MNDNIMLSELQTAAFTNTYNLACNISANSLARLGFIITQGVQYDITKEIKK